MLHSFTSQFLHRAIVIITASVFGWPCKLQRRVVSMVHPWAPEPGEGFRRGQVAGI
jgi:hypothetical protein